MSGRQEQVEAIGREMSERLVGRIMIGSLVVGFLILAAVVATAGWLLLRSQEFNQAVEQTYEVETRLADFRVSLERSESARRGFLLSGGEGYRRLYSQNSVTLHSKLQELRRLTSDNPEQQARTAELEPLLEEKLVLLRRSVEERAARGLAGGLAAFDQPRDQPLLDEIRTLSARMAATERRLLADRSARQTTNARALLAVVALAGFLLAAITAGSTWVMRRFARDLTRSRGELKRLNEGLEDAVLDRTRELTRANEEIQRFAYIVSHDLRAPLVNITGFTGELEAAAKPLQKLLQDATRQAPEIVTREAREAVELDLPESLGFIRSSTQKMDRLIGSILKLSREGRRILQPEALDMNTMLEVVVASVQHLVDDRGVDLRIEAPIPDLVADRLAVEQVFSNLVENAVKYLKPGRPGVIRIRGREAGTRVIFEVEDNGRGVDPKDQERIFEPFRRAGAQDQPGEGIGLAHVRALVYRLGGLIDCVSALDQGATFRISLPRVTVTAGELA